MSDSFFGDVTSFLNDARETVDSAQNLVSEVQAGGGGHYPPQGGAVSSSGLYSGVPSWVWLVGGAAIILAVMWGGGSFSKLTK